MHYYKTNYNTLQYFILNVVLSLLTCTAVHLIIKMIKLIRVIWVLRLRLVVLHLKNSHVVKTRWKIN